MTITPRQFQVLKLVDNSRQNRCYSITMQELANILGTSRTTVFEHIAGLKEKGLLSAAPGKARSLNLTSKALKLLKESAVEDSASAESNDGIPLLGRIAAGSPIEAIENAERISMQTTFGNDENTFALKVQGDSMIGDGIFDGDYVVCQKTNVAQNGRIVAAVVDNDSATVKRFFKEADKVRLEPSNPAYKPIYTQNCTIAGVVVGLMRKL
ncbi:MAG: repressor LexA [Planctomycetes bacterium GWF2_42_9]|nr:MAG: repressor LexA [Planctomycetes bacterium GWF2_42_9]